MNFADDLKAMPPIQWNVCGIRRFQVRRQPGGIAFPECFREKRVAMALTLPGWVGADERQFPTRWVRLKITHFLEGVKNVVADCRVDFRFQQSGKVVVIRLRSRGQPYGGGGEIVCMISAAGIDRRIGNNLHHRRKDTLVFVRLRQHPPDEGVRDKRQNQRVDKAGLVRRRHFKNHANLRDAAITAALLRQ